jgi:hypothetical protein
VGESVTTKLKLKISLGETVLNYVDMLSDHEYLFLGHWTTDGGL